EAENMAYAASALAAASYDGMPPDQIIFGNTRTMKELRDKLEKLALTNIPVLVRGETGTGKEIIAQVIHRSSPRPAAPFVRVTCSAIGGTRLEEELFGYEQGGSAGGENTKPEVLKRAAHGSLFLDEIGDLNKGMQAKLLQFLQDRHFNST